MLFSEKEKTEYCVLLRIVKNESTLWFVVFKTMDAFTLQIFDNDKKLFKYEFSINNFSKSTINNFAYSVVFLNSKGVAITSVDKFFYF